MGVRGVAGTVIEVAGEDVVEADDPVGGEDGGLDPVVSMTWRRDFYSGKIEVLERKMASRW